MNEHDVGVAAVGDVLDINTWSNIPYFFFTTGKERDIFSQPWRLDLSVFANSRKVWNAKQLLLGRGTGGYQYSDEFIQTCEGQIPPEYFQATVISFNQAFPRAESVKRAGGRIFYYIDATLHDLFNSKLYNIKIPGRMKAAAIEQETVNYKLADGVVTMGSWSFDTLRDFYKLDPSKVHQVLPGANVIVPDDFKPKSFSGKIGVDKELILGFVGKDWKRKGLPLLVDVRDILQSLGIKTKVVVIGNAPDELKDRDGVIDSGYINKHTDTRKFIDAVSSCDFGCLFSSSEALGISTLEFIRLGVPVMGFYHQGLKDTLLDGASLRFNLDDNAQTIADTIASVVRDNARMSSLKGEAIRQSNSVTWNVCVDKWKSIIR
jgi:glycosyltransferase involved in cell wall biosynthesis